MNAPIPGTTLFDGAQARKAGGNIYYLAKFAGIFGLSVQDVGAQQTGKPEHLANLIAFLASDEAEMITGQFMLADGGGYLH